MGKIEVNGLRFYSHHGCMAQETKIGGLYQVDVVIFADLGPSSKSDNLNETVDYCAVHKIVARKSTPLNLLSTSENAFRFPQI